MNLFFKGCLILSAALISHTVSAAEVQKFLFDFGPNNVANRGNITPADAADANGNYWNNIHSTSGNNITAGSVFSIIQNTAGTTVEGMSLTVNGQFNTNGLSGGGGLTSPSADLLGELAIATATGDYMFLDGNNVDNRAFTIAGLDSDHAYTFAIFSSRAANDNRIGRFTIDGFNSFVGENQAAGSGIGANGENQNTSVVLISEPVFPTAEGTIKITVSRVSGAYIPLNCMSMTENSDVPRPTVDTFDRKFYFDFGATDKAANKCVITESPDTNGNHWNNITNSADGSKYADRGSVYSGMIDAEGNATTLSITLNDRFSTNGMSGGGGLLAPDASLLGDFAVESATADYFFYEADQSDCSMNFEGLNPDKAYKFYIFASRSASDNRTGVYRLSGYNLWSGKLQAAGSNLGGSGVNQNNSTILVSDYVFADADGKLKLTISRESGTYIPLNCMKIEEYSDIDRPIIKNYTAVSLNGTAIDGRKVVIERGMVDGVATNVFSGVADFGSGEFILVATDENGLQHRFGASETSGRLAENGSAIVSQAYPTLIEIDLDAMTYTLTALQNIRLIGSAVGSWSLNDYKEMTYSGDLVFTWQGDLEGHDTSTDSGRLGLYINGSWTAFKRDHIDENYNAVLTLGNGADIPVNPGSYKLTFNLEDMVLKFENGKDALDADRITVFGSSVANGQGAEQIDNENQGYMYLYGRQLADRKANGLSHNPFYISNISIGGNSTVMLLNRYDDMRREFGKYVVFGVSLGNEGIHDSKDKPATYNQFKNNMLKLIEMVRADGKVPVICNNYTRGDFTDEDYSYILQMDREIGLWDLPSINLLGAIDSKTGQWADGYQNGTDIYHPNQQGHQEFAYAMVPSLFDALESGKALCTERVSGEGINLESTELTAVPEGTLHSFALVTVGCSSAASAQIAAIDLADENCLTINYADGKFSATVGNRSVEVSGNFDVDHTMVALSYTYSSAILDLEVYNGNTLAGRGRLTDVTIEPLSFSLGASDYTLGEAMLFRSALSPADVESLAAGELQKGSLEIYSALNNDILEQRTQDAPATIENMAMSLNSFERNSTATSSVSGVSSATVPVRYFSIEGLEVEKPAKGTFYIALEGQKARKVIF